MQQTEVGMLPMEGYLDKSKPRLLPDLLVEFEIVHPDDLQKSWPLALAGVQYTREKLGASWDEFTVYHELACEASELILVYANGAFAGFFVITVGKDCLFIWIAYSALAGDIDIFDITLNELEALAKENDLRDIKFGSTRKGWEKVAEKHGFVFEEIRYTKRVT